MHRAAATGETSVIVVEGFFDYMKVHQAGMRFVVALMGSALYEPQRRALLSRFRQVILMLDGDMTGRKANIAVAAKLKPRRQVQVVDLAVGVQPDQLSMEEIRKALEPALQRRLAVR